MNGLQDRLRILRTGDGSPTLYRTDLDETYHSTHGAVQESLLVYIRNGLDWYAGGHPRQGPVRVFEVGFGTGLNALLSLRWSLVSGVGLDYTAIEPFPLPESLTGILDYATGLEWEEGGGYFAELHRAPWARRIPVAAGFTLEKILVPLEDYVFPPGQYQVVYYDAFAPSKQPGMWHKENLTRVRDALETGGVLVTYCAQGQFRRDLRDMGFRVELLPGPPGKREVLRAVKS